MLPACRSASATAAFSISARVPMSLPLPAPFSRPAPADLRSLPAPAQEALGSLPGFAAVQHEDASTQAFLAETACFLRAVALPQAAQGLIVGAPPPRPPRPPPCSSD